MQGGWEQPLLVAPRHRAMKQVQPESPGSADAAWALAPASEVSIVGSWSEMPDTGA